MASSSSTSTSNAGTANNFRYLYEITGDSNAALSVLNNQQADDNNIQTYQPSPESNYNRHLLEACAVGNTGDDDDSSTTTWLHSLSEKEAALICDYDNTNNNTASNKKFKVLRDDWIATYNKSLIMLTQGQTLEAIELVWNNKLGPIINSSSNNGNTGDINNNATSSVVKLTKELTSIGCRMAFLVLEGILTYFTIPTSHDIISGECIITLPQSGETINHEAIVKWLSKVVTDNNICNDDPSLKFQLTLYRGRLDFLERKNSKLVDARVRSCRKELKHAMEIFQHKLRPQAEKSSTNNYDNQSIDASSTGALSADNSEKFLAHTNSGVSQTTTAGTTSQSQRGSGNDDSNQNEKLSKVLQVQNSAALNLKANTEQLKGNIKKSLILLAEASPMTNETTNDTTTPTTTTDDDDNDNDNTNKKTDIISGSSTSNSNSSSSNYYESLHYNNLGIVYNTNGKKHLALLAWSKAMNKCSSSAANQSQRKLFEPEGTACLDVKLQVYYNSAIGSIQVQNYDAAYQCLSAILRYCLSSSSSNNNNNNIEPTTTSSSSYCPSHTWHLQPKVWLRLSEACIGIGAKLKKQYGTSKFSKITGTKDISKKDNNNKTGEQKEEEKDPADSQTGEVFQGILLDSSFDKNKFDKSDLDHPLGSEEDWEYVQKNPYTRARWALEIAIALFEQNKKNDASKPSSSYDKENTDSVGLSNAHLSLAYVCLEQSDFKQALQEAEWVLNNAPSATNDSASSVTGTSTTTDSVRTSLIKRQLATARMYASEAACALGQTTRSLQHLVGDGKDDAFDRLASDLAGVTLASASKSSDGKSRLAKAQSSVRCSASIASCELGNLTAAKQLAMSAQAMEAASQPRNAVAAAAAAAGAGGGQDGSLAKRALVYCNLRERQVQAEQQRILMQQQGGMGMQNTGSSNTSLTFTLMRSSR